MFITYNYIENESAVFTTFTYLQNNYIVNKTRQLKISYQYKKTLQKVYQNVQYLLHNNYTHV